MALIQVGGTQRTAPARQCFPQPRATRSGRHHTKWPPVMDPGASGPNQPGWSQPEILAAQVILPCHGFQPLASSGASRVRGSQLGSSHASQAPSPDFQARRSPAPLAGLSGCRRPTTHRQDHQGGRLDRYPRRAAEGRRHPRGASSSSYETVRPSASPLRSFASPSKAGGPISSTCRHGRGRQVVPPGTRRSAPIMRRPCSAPKRCCFRRSTLAIGDAGCQGTRRPDRDARLGVRGIPQPTGASPSSTRGPSAITKPVSTSWAVTR